MCPFCSRLLAIAVAFLRYRLFDIDVLINRALVYGGVTVTLAFAYVGGVVSLQGLFHSATGQESNLAIISRPS